MLYCEKYCCLVLAITTAVIAYFTSPFPLAKGDEQFFIELFTTYATISSLLAGLMTTATSNFLSHSYLINLLKKHRLFQPIVSYAQQATIFNCIALSLSFVLIFGIKFYPSHKITCLIYYVLSFVAGYSFMAFIRASYIFARSSSKAMELDDNTNNI